MMSMGSGFGRGFGYRMGEEAGLLAGAEAAQEHGGELFCVSSQNRSVVTATGDPGQGEGV